jgi:hypothetical protein
VASCAAAVAVAAVAVGATAVAGFCAELEAVAATAGAFPVRVADAVWAAAVAEAVPAGGAIAAEGA